jgi:hypothetical protein
MTGSSVATPVNALSTGGAWYAAGGGVPTTVTSGRLIEEMQKMFVDDKDN